MLSDDLHKLPLTHLPRPGLAKRLLAGIYDWLLVTAILMVVSVPLVALQDDAVTPGNNLYRVALIAVAGCFFIGFWSRGGQTLGMRAWRLRVITTAGHELSLTTALLRYIYAWLSLVPAGLGFWWAWFDAERCTWHDRLSGTRLVVLPRQKEP